MPKLRKRKDGGYYIYALIHAAGHIATLQISDKGAAWLKTRGVDVDDEIDTSLLRELTRRGYTSSGGSGFQGEQVIPVPSGIPSAPESPGKQRGALHLAFKEEDNGWSLSVVFPELPAKWLQQLDANSLKSLLASCRLSLGEGQISITHLWPGSGGASLRVVPQEKPYKINILGAWPDVWDINTWACAVDGVDLRGTLFAGEDGGGLLLYPDEQLVRGASYYLIARQDFPRSPARFSIQSHPSSVEVKRLISWEGWDAWKFTLPPVIDRLTRIWCQSLGHSVEEAPWHLRVVSPPPLRYELNKTPIFKVGDEVILAIIPPSDQSSFQSPDLIVYCDGLRCFSGSTFIPSSRGLSYLAIPINKAGRYQLSDAINRSKVAPCFFLAEGPAAYETAPSLGLAPLRVRIQSGPNEFSLDAFADGVGPHQREVHCSEESATPLLEVTCPVPVTVSWSGGGGRILSQEMSAAQVAEYVIPDLLKSLESGQPFILNIDAGSFGLLRLHLLPAGFQQVAQTSPFMAFAESSIPAQLLSRARWLAITLSAMERQKGMPMMPLPQHVKTTLDMLAAREDCAFLARVTQVPISLMPHLLALARSLQRSGHLTMSTTH